LSGRIAIWLMSFAVSFAVHAAILAGVLKFEGTPGSPPAAELLIGDEAAFSALVVSPITGEAGSAKLIADVAGNAVAAAGTAHELAAETNSQILPPVETEKPVPAKVLAELAPAARSDTDVHPVASKPLAGPSDAQPLPPASDHQHIAPGSAESSTLSPVGETHQLTAAAGQGVPGVHAPSAESSTLSPVGETHQLTAAAGQGVPGVHAPSTEAEPVRTQAEIASAQDATAQKSPIAEEPRASETADGAQLLAPAGESEQTPEAVESSVQPNQPVGQSIVAGSSPAPEAEQVESGTKLAPSSDNGAQNAPVATQALAPEEIGSATLPSLAGESAPLSPSVEDDVQVSQSASQAANSSVAETVPLMPAGGGQRLAAVADEGKRIESGEAVASARAPVQSEIKALAAPPAESGSAVPVVSEAQQPATNTTLAMVAPHPAIVLPPTDVLPDDPSLRVANFIRDYDGGFCFFAVARRLDSQKPLIEGFGSRPDLIRSFGESFRRALGITPELGMRQITEPQCPAIGFIGRILKSRLPEITVRLEVDSLANGDELKGTLDGVRLSHVRLLLVDDDGIVHDISRYLRRTVDGLDFAAPVFATGQGRLRNQLIVSVAADRELGIMKTTKPVVGADYFSSLAREADASGAAISVGVGAFQVE
jgi:hypothetical protein